MAAFAGRDLRIKYDSGGGAAVIAGAQSGSFSWSLEGIDITDKDDVGVRTMLNDIGTKALDLSVEGVMKDDTLLALAAAATTGAALHDFEVAVGALGTLAGSFFISSFENTGAEGAEATTFTCALQSAGAITYTATP